MISDFGWEIMAKKVEVIQTNQADKPFIQIDYQILTADIVFDSRNPQFHTPKNFETHLWQSFVGWKIKTKELYFQPNDFRMMDFTTPQDNFTQFVYVLPYSEHEALIEITRFGKEVIPQDLAELRLTEYIHNFNVAYSIEDTETGCIPMSNAQLKTHPLPGVINLGGRANLIKPSTGYAFKSMYSHADKIAETIKRQTTNSWKSFTLESHSLFPTKAPSRFKFYDSLLLKILDQQPHWGKPIFEQLFNRVQIPQVMQFLDEKTTLIQDIHILRKLPFKPFLRVLFQHPFIQSLYRPLGLLLIAATLLLLGNSYLQTIIGDSLLILGLITVGIPHGAVDHLLETKQWNKQTAPGFIVKYLLIGALFAATWLLLPNLCLMFFLLYSAWHFGQADGELWRMSKPQTLSWGTTVLSFIILSHWKESAEIISGITGTNWNTFQISGDLQSKLQFISPFIAIVFFPWVYYSVKNRNWGMSITIVWLVASAMLPLMWSFGLYFIGQHSINGWYKIKKHLQISHQRLWVQSLPFHLGAWGLLLLFYGLFRQSSLDSTSTHFNLINYVQNLNPNLSTWAPFFIFLACISLPHTLAMHKLYKK